MFQVSESVNKNNEVKENYHGFIMEKSGFAGLFLYGRERRIVPIKFMLRVNLKKLYYNNNNYGQNIEIQVTKIRAS